jgi:TPP-dependent pyruvate/acetoin dehydrogenase alpha subunit
MQKSSASEQSSPTNKAEANGPPETWGPRNNEVVRILEMFRTMHLIRAFDHAAARAWHEGRVRGSVHQYIGEEAIAVGVCANLRRVDYLASYHRGHGHAIAKGADVTRMMKELFGRFFCWHDRRERGGRRWGYHRSRRSAGCEAPW